MKSAGGKRWSSRFHPLLSLGVFIAIVLILAMPGAAMAQSGKLYIIVY